MSELTHSISRQLAVVTGGALLIVALIFWLGFMDLVWGAIDGVIAMLDTIIQAVL